MSPQNAAKPDSSINVSDTPAEWVLNLYIAGETSRSVTALNNLRMICENHLKGRYSIEVIDLRKNPKLASKDEILAMPTVVRKLPQPLRRIIGDLSDTERVLVGLQIKPGC